MVTNRESKGSENSIYSMVCLTSLESDLLGPGDHGKARESSSMHTTRIGRAGVFECHVNGAYKAYRAPTFRLP